MWAAVIWWRRLSLPWDSQTAIASVVPAALLMMAIWWLWWRLPRRQLHKLDVQIHDPKARADTEDNFRKTVGQALGGAAVLIGAGAAYLQFTQQQQAVRDQLQASHDLLISNQVSKGFEQLAGKEMAMRLGGIYALEGVMNTSEQYHRSVLEALCAFVRDSTTPHDSTTANTSKSPATDVQAALSVIGRRKPGDGDVNLSGANIHGANLSGANLSGAFLSNANLSEAALNSANLAGLEVSAGVIRFTDLRGVNLGLADLGGANLSVTELTHADLHGADLRNATLKDADLGDADLTDADLTDVRDLKQDILDRACGKPKALPPGLTLERPCPPPPTPR
jgi:hypothetical protein